MPELKTSPQAKVTAGLPTQRSTYISVYQNQQEGPPTQRTWLDVVPRASDSAGPGWDQELSPLVKRSCCWSGGHTLRPRGLSGTDNLTGLSLAISHPHGCSQHSLHTDSAWCCLRSTRNRLLRTAEVVAWAKVSY